MIDNRTQSEKWALRIVMLVFAVIIVLSVSIVEHAVGMENDFWHSIGINAAMVGGGIWGIICQICGEIKKEQKNASNNL